MWHRPHTPVRVMPAGLVRMAAWFRNIVNMLHGVRDGLVRDANNYEQQEQASQQILSS